MALRTLLLSFLLLSQDKPQPQAQSQVNSVSSVNGEDRLNLDLSLCSANVEWLKGITLQLQSENRKLADQVKDLQKQLKEVKP